MEKITEKEEIEEEKSEVREWTEEDDDEIGNMVDPYYELQKKNSSRQGNLRGGQYHDLAKRLSQYLYLFSFFLLFSYQWTCKRKMTHREVWCYAAREFSAEIQYRIQIITLDFTIGTHSRDLL